MSVCSRFTEQHDTHFIVVKSQCFDFYLCSLKKAREFPDKSIYKSKDHGSLY